MELRDTSQSVVSTRVPKAESNDAGSERPPAAPCSLRESATAEPGHAHRRFGQHGRLQKEEIAQLWLLVMARILLSSRPAITSMGLGCPLPEALIGARPVMMTRKAPPWFALW